MASTSGASNARLCGVLQHASTPEPRSPDSTTARPARHTSALPSPPLDSPDCGCGWRAYALELRSDFENLKGEFDALKRHVFGKKSEKMPPMDREVQRGKKADPAETRRKRKEKALAKEKLVT